MQFHLLAKSQYVGQQIIKTQIHLSSNSQFAGQSKKGNSFVDLLFSQ
jgi:hypothetical protein